MVKSAHTYTASSRRQLLVGIAAASAAVVTGLVAADPIYSAISAHRQAAADFLIQHAAYVAAWPDADHVPATDAMSAWVRAAEAVAGTMPTTLAGVEALRLHLLDKETNSNLVRSCIVMPNGLGGAWSTYGDAAVEYLAARHAARLAGWWLKRADSLLAVCYRSWRIGKVGKSRIARGWRNKSLSALQTQLV